MADVFSDAVREFAAVVGEDWVYTGSSARALYRDDYSPFAGSEDDPVPAAVVAPASTQEVQQFVKICSDRGIPFWTISTGKNLGFGGAAPMKSNMITLDLKRMNRIIEVNENQAYVVVEPGVSFLDLYRHIQAKGIKLWMNVPSPGWGSVLANSLEHGTGYAFQGDHFQNLCGMEVVLPTGDILRTGMGAMENPAQWHTLKYSLGAHLDGLFAQSNLGVVTRAGCWLMPEPEAFISAMVKTYGMEDLIPLVDLTRDMRLRSLLQGSVRISVGMTDLAHDESFDLTGFDAINSPAEMERAMLSVMKEKNLGTWHARMGFYGSEKIVRAQWEEVQNSFRAISGAQFSAEFFRTPLQNPHQLDVKTKLIAGIPSLADWVTNGRIQGHMLDSPVLPADGAAALKAHQLATRIHADFGRPFNGSEMLNRTPRELLMTMGAEIYKNDRAENEKSLALFRQINEEFAKFGWGEVRAHPALMGVVQESYSWNNHAQRRVNEILKDALDPAGVMAPGKNGIYPQRMRETRS